MNIVTLRRRGISELPIKEKLKKLGCIMWFPLDEENGLNDVIGDKVITVIPQLESNAYIKWDDNKEMYAFFTESRSYPCGRIDTGFDAQTFVNGYSALIFGEAINQRGTSGLIINNDDNVICCNTRNTTSNIANWNAYNFIPVITIAYSDGRKIYENTVKVIDDSHVYNYTDAAWANPINIKIYSTGTWARSSGMYFKNLMIFNKTLTEAEYFRVLDILGWK